MEKKEQVTGILAVLGTVLAWFPIALPVLFSALAFAQERKLRFDFLLPAEIFPVALVGAGLLVWAALRAGLRRRVIGWSVAILFAGLLGAIVLAQVTGLASGATEPVGWQAALVNGFFVVFWLGLIGMAVGGTLLWRDLKKKNQSPPFP